jgi:hypothetical protein
MKNIFNCFQEMLNNTKYCVLFEDGSRKEIMLDRKISKSGKITDIGLLVKILEQVNLKLELTPNGDTFIYRDYSLIHENQVLKLITNPVPVTVDQMNCAEYLWYEYRFPEMNMSFQAQKTDLTNLQIKHITNIIQLTVYSAKDIKELVSANFDGPYHLPYTILAIYKAVKSALENSHGDIASNIEYSLSDVNHPNVYIMSAGVNENNAV